MPRRKKVEPEVDATVQETKNIMTPSGHLKLHEWEPEEDDIFFYKDGSSVVARYDKILNFKKEKFCKFLIISNHYVGRMADILQHINYFIKYYDPFREYVMSIFSIKFMLDTKGGKMTPQAFKSYIVNRVITDSFMQSIADMVNDLYDLNIDSDDSGHYKSTPKITNSQAKVILAMSFAIRLILPICIHYINITPYAPHRGDYIVIFDKIFNAVYSKMEAFFDTPTIDAVAKFIEYRIVKHRHSDAGILEKKRQVHADNLELYIHMVIHEVILVKSIYKINYEMSVVSYFDGIVSKNYGQYRKEPFKCKPVEISAEDSQRDSDDFLSQAEALEMSIYRIDEGISFINDANISLVIESIFNRFKAIQIDRDEFEFYYENIRINQITQMLLHAFYSEFFEDSFAINLITRKQAVWLILILKKYLQLKGMTILPQLCTASVIGRFKENVIKNRKFVEKLETSAAYDAIIKTKFRYIDELNLKDPPIKKYLSTIINSSFKFVDYDPELNGISDDDVYVDMIIDEFLNFLSII